MPTITKQFYLVLAVGAFFLGFLGSRILYHRDQRILTPIDNSTLQPPEEVYGVKRTPAGLIDDYERTNEEIARRIGEETPSYPRKEHIYQGGLWEWLKNYFYNKWLAHKDKKEALKEMGVQEKKDLDERVAESMKEKDVLTKAAQKIDEKFEEIKEGAKEQIKEGVKKVLGMKEHPLHDEVLEKETGHKDIDDSSLDTKDSSAWTESSLSESDIKNTVNKVVRPEETMQEIKEALKEVAELGLGDKKKHEEILDKSKEKVDKKFGEVKEGIKDFVKEGIRDLTGMKRKGEDRLSDIKEEVKDVKDQWETAKKKLDEKFGELKDSAKNMMVDELEKVTGQEIGKKEIPKEAAKAIDDKLDEVAEKHKGMMGRAKEKIDEKMDSLKHKAKESIKSGVKSFFEKAAEKVKSLFSSSGASHDASHDIHSGHSSRDESHELMEVPETPNVNPDIGTGAQKAQKTSKIPEKVNGGRYKVPDERTIL